MKLFHLSDLHIGKPLMDMPLLEDQRWVFERILSLMDEEQPDAVMICGDVYDSSRPSADAMELLDAFLNGLAARGKPVLIISGNHDSPERLTFARSFLKRSNIHVSPVYDGHIEPVVLRDGHGEVSFWLMPYVHPDNAARFFKGTPVRNADDAARAVIGEMKVDTAGRNVILSHQLIVGGSTSGSERPSIGSLENVSVSLYDAFDYVALGHLHRPQNVGRKDGTMRYCGTPLMYSRSELGWEKSVTVVELEEKGNVRVRTLPLGAKRPLRLVRGLFEDLEHDGPAAGTENDLYFIDLTDETDVPNAAARLRERFPGLVCMSYDNDRTRGGEDDPEPPEPEEKQPLELVKDLYRLVNNRAMSDEAADFVRATLKRMEDMQP